MTTLFVPPAVNAATRREFLALIATTGLLTACGSAADPRTGPETRTVETLFGPRQVPVSPRRIAIVDGYTGLDTAALVGAPIVGLSRKPMISGGLPRYLDPADFVDAPDLGWTDINVEQVAAVAPDLIVGADFLEKPVVARLDQIAPVVAFENVAYNWTEPTDWQINVRRIAGVLGRSGAAEPEIARVEARIDRLRERLADRRDRLTVSAVRVRADFVQLFPGQGPGSAVLERLGIARPAGQRPTDEPVDFSLENIGDSTPT